MLFHYFDVVSPYEEFVYETKDRFPWIFLIVAILLIISIIFIVRKIRSKRKMSPSPEYDCAELPESSENGERSL